MHLPAAGLHEVLLLDGGGGEAFHAADDGFAGFGDDLGVVEVGGGDDDGASAGDGLFALDGIVLNVERGGALLHEDAGADEDGFGAELHHQGSVSGRGDAAGGEVGHGQLAGLGDHAHQLVGGLEFLGGVVELLVV